MDGTNDRAQPISAALARIQPSTCIGRPSETLPTRNAQLPAIPARIRGLISEVGLRYRPALSADLEAHAGTLALLARDLAHLDPADLSEAIQAHVLKCPFMPKAAELAVGAEAAAVRRKWAARGVRVVPAERRIEPPVREIPASEIRGMTENFRRMGLANGWITQAQVDAAMSDEA